MGCARSYVYGAKQVKTRQKRKNVNFGGKFGGQNPATCPRQPTGLRFCVVVPCRPLTPNFPDLFAWLSTPAMVMNDSVVLIFSVVVVGLCGRHTVAKSFPCLLSFATKANTCSVLTMTGNPKTILIVSLLYGGIGPAR